MPFSPAHHCHLPPSNTLMSSLFPKHIFELAFIFLSELSSPNRILSAGKTLFLDSVLGYKLVFRECELFKISGPNVSVRVRC